MKSTLEKVGTLQRKLNVLIPAAAVATEFDVIYKDIQKQANIKGFRQGKAPIATIKSIYGDRVKSDVTQNLIQKYYSTALREHSLEPISYPEFEFDAPDAQKDFTFSANFEIKPDVNLKKYEGLVVEKEKYETDEQHLNQILENIRASKAELVPVLEDRPAQMGDVAVLDFDGYMNGAPLDGGAGKDHNLELGAKQFIEGFEDGIVGMKVGAEKTISLKFPDPYASPELAGKPVDFKVKLNGLKAKRLPELTDDFVNQMMGQSEPGKTHTVASLKETIQKDIEQSEQKRIETDFKNRLLKKLVEENPVEVPNTLMQEQKQALIADMKKKMQEQGMGEGDFEQYAAKWNTDFENTAKDMIQSGFLVDAVAKKYDLIWTEADFDAKMQEYAKQTGIEETRIREFYSKPEQQQRVTYMITEEKVIKHLTDKAKVKEVSKADIKNAQN